MMRRNHPGFVLPMTLIFVVLASIVLGSVIGYVSGSARLTRESVTRDRCRFAAQSAIEQAKVEIQEGFSKFVSDNFSSVQILPRKTKVFNWLDTIGSDRRTIGSSSPVTIFDGLEMPIAVNGCRVWVGIGYDVEHETDGAQAVVPIVATAEYEHSDGHVVRVTIGEWIIFGTEQSYVFDNAYFVNNYGWMSGNFTINGEFRANGNVSLTGGAVVNGSIYAAPNSEIGAAGTVSLGSASICNQSRYRSSVGSRARYDTGNLDEIGSYDAAYVSGSIAAASYDSDGNLVGGSRNAALDEDGNIVAGDEPIVHQTQTIAGEESTVDPVAMPFISDLTPYVEYAQEEKGTLTYPAVTYTDGTGASHTTAAGTISAHRSVSEAGPSGDASLADAGSVLLVGTRSNPIRINGPVVVDGDVIIKGYVTGQGTIYAGRNIHVVGDIKYVNAPSWTHSADETSATAEQSANDAKDMLGLMAKGNVVIGDATSSSIAETVNGVSESYACDASDASIGYNSTFDGNYSATEKVTGLSSTLAASAPGGYDSSSGNFGKVRTVTEYYTETETYQQYNRWTRQYETKTRTVRKSRKELSTSYDRRYYETICDNAIISSLRSTISQIDAVMYNNHGVFGSLGANFAINGALVCRDEGLTANGGTFNWDMRLRRKKDSEVVSKLGLPKGAGDPYTCRWQELPDSANPVYRAAKGAEQ